ncbi:MAG: lipocalin family protein [Bacteroidota bacterium]
MRGFWVLMLVTTGLGCSEKKVHAEDLHLLNGYWQIQEVKMQDGTSRTYGPASVIDYIVLKDKKGYKKKVQPRIDGTYKVSKDQEPLEIRNSETGFMMFYQNTLSSWQDRLVALDSLHYSIVNEDGITYTYTRYQPISIEP